jgi:hypothetical protein
MGTTALQRSFAHVSDSDSLKVCLHEMQFITLSFVMVTDKTISICRPSPVWSQAVTVAVEHLSLASTGNKNRTQVARGLWDITGLVTRQQMQLNRLKRTQTDREQVQVAPKTVRGTCT